jgi:16S rRNA (adenine1518-N6/adenine1519-N6)-dimethyltransferase
MRRSDGHPTDAADVLVTDGGRPELGDRDPDALRRRAGVRGDTRQDQHFLIDDRVLDRLPTYLTDIDADTSHILEIGAGTGALTDRLLTVADHVTAIERDPELADFLREEFAGEIDAGLLTIIEGDALEIELPDVTASVSNLPYGAASEFLFRLLPRSIPLVLTVQQEFGERLVASAGSNEYGRLAVSAGHYASTELVESVPPTAFDPQPAVDSAIVRTTPREPTYEIDDPDFFLGFVKAVFTQRRKTLRNAIRNTTHISGIEDSDAVLDQIEASRLDQRPEKIEPTDFADLATIADEYGRG